MSQFKLDRLRFNWRGAWASTSVYIKDDIVEFAGSTYVCKTGHTSSGTFNSDFGPIPQDNIVTVRRNTADNANVYYINGTERPSLILNKGLTYTFNQDDLSNIHFPNAIGGAIYAHPLLFSKTENGTLVNSGYRYEDGVRYYLNKAEVSATDYINNFATAIYREIRIDVPADATNLYYFCAAHTGMGTSVDTSNVAKWEHQVHGNVYKNDWAISTIYHIGDIVTYGGNLYIANTAHTSAATSGSQTFVITVAQNNQPPGNNVYVIDGVQYPNLQFITGYTYTFNQNDNSNITHPLNFSTTKNGTHAGGTAFENNVSYFLDGSVVANAAAYNTGFSAATTRRVEIVVTSNTPNPLYYYCYNHSGMSVNAKIDTLTAGLENDVTNWTQYSYQDDYKSNWSTGTRYKLNDVVRNNGTLYRCITPHTSAATVILGIENDIAKWTVVYQQVNYLQIWSTNTNYRIFDLVKVGASVWKCETQHISDTFQNDYANWSLYLDGLEWGNAWSAATFYQIGDIVDYGGYTYRAVLSNINIKPQATDTATWQQVSESYDHKGEYAFDSSRIYQVGDVVRHNGYLYVAILDNEGVIEPPSVSHWQVIIPGRQWRGQWEATQEYKLEDLATFGANTYICNEKHLSTALNSPVLNSALWTLHSEGKATNVLTTKGDMITYDGTNPTQLNKKRFPVGNTGAVLRSLNGIELQWDNIDLIPQVFYVAPGGSDLPVNGKSTSSPFATIKYATQYIQDNVDVDTLQTTIFVKTGIYSEILPISIPKNCALVGDELRSTVVQPAAGYTSSKMFYVRDGSGIRNLTMQGLLDALGSTNEYLTKRPANDAAYVSLDPGTGPADTSVWILTRSPYIQNVTTLGTGVTGLKIDGALHDGGNDSIVANDFTQVLSDGIGVWCTNLGRTELVSVFTYYNHIGYLAENGGKIRATNGNNSYGSYGSVAEGVDADETPISATVNNRAGHAIVSNIVTDGNEILVVEYVNAGENYDSSTSYVITGAGQDAAVSSANVRNGGIYQVRLTGLTATPLGASYLQVEGNAQDGGSINGEIVISGADTNTFANYEGMRLVITSGAGAGQYGHITLYNQLTKLITVSTETTDSFGWDHFVTGTSIVSPDATSRYRIEPRVIVTSPISGTQPIIRAFISGGGLGEFRIIEPGSGYPVGGVPPTITIIDPNRTSDAAWQIRVGNGVLAQPNWSNRGVNYLTAFVATITGAGYADQYSVGPTINVSSLTQIPGPGANLEFFIEFLDSHTFYSVVEVTNITGSPGNQSATLAITPYLRSGTSPEHATAITIRENFSQCRLTGHDFLDVGTGGTASTQYPARYLEGYDSENNPSQPNEVVGGGGGRVFYTSTDQDGNFRVGELFQVQQASGVITLNADDFQLSGLTELRIGGVSLGGTSAVIREFSTDRTFAANSDNIVPTQKAIALYIEDQIGGGGADIVVSGLMAGQTSILNGNEISSATEIIEFPNQMNFTAGVIGDMLQASLFIQGNR